MSSQKKNRKLNRRDFLRGSAIAASSAALAACGAQPVPETVIETVIVEKDGETIVETVEVEKEVVKEVEKEVVVTATPAPVGQIPLTYMRWGGVDREQARINDTLEMWPELAEKYTIEVISPGKHDAEVYNFLRLALAAGTELPTMVQMNYIGVPEFASAGLLTDMKEWMAPYADDMLPATHALSDYEGSNVTVPRSAKTKIWYYRKDMFEEAGIDPAAIKTFEDYMAAGWKFRDTFPDSYIMNIGPQPIHYWYFMIMTHWDADEIRIANVDGSYNLVGNERYETLLTWLNEWYSSGIAFNTDDWSPDWQPAFNDGVIAGDLVSQWMDYFLPGFAPEQGGLWGKTVWPEFNRAGSEAGGDILTIPLGVPNAEGAFEYMAKSFLDTEGAVDLFEYESRAPMIASARDEVLEMVANFEKPAELTDEEWKIHPINYFGPTVLDSHYEAMNDFKVFPYDPAASAELDILRKHTESFLAQKETLEEALAGAQGDMEAQIGNPYEA